MGSPWQISYRAVLKEDLPMDEVGSLEAALSELDGTLPGQLPIADRGDGRTVLEGEVGLDPDDAPEADRLLAALSDLARRFPGLDVHARDSLGLIVSDMPSRAFALQGVGDGATLDGPDGWGESAFSSPFTDGASGDVGDADGDQATERLHCVGDGRLARGLQADVSARYRAGMGGRIVLLHGTLDGDEPASARHLYAQEVLVRAADGRLLARGARAVGLDFWRVAELRIGVALRQEDVDYAATIELWVDLAERATHVLARYRAGEALMATSAGRARFDARLDAQSVDWPMPGLALTGELTHQGDGLLTRATVRFAVRDTAGAVVDEDELDIGPLIPGERRAVGCELAWGLEESVAGGDVTLGTVSRRRVLVWRGSLARLTVCR